MMIEPGSKDSALLRNLDLHCTPMAQLLRPMGAGFRTGQGPRHDSLICQSPHRPVVGRNWPDWVSRGPTVRSAIQMRLSSCSSAICVIRGENAHSLGKPFRLTAQTCYFLGMMECP